MIKKESGDLMKYIEFKVHTSRQGLEQVTAMLMQQGICEVSIDDPADMEDILNKKNEYGWDYIDDRLKEELDREPTLSVYFEDTEENREKIQNLKIDVMKLKSRELEGVYGWKADFGRLYVETSVVDDNDWKDKWKEFFKPVKVTDRIVVKPTWEEYTVCSDELVLQIDPGMAFGTGTHETTSLCMKLMEKYMEDAPENKKVLDVGCGSGILSIAGALLGSKEVLGIEIDEDAVRVARENVELNKVEQEVKVKQGDLTKGIDFKADIVVANLMADLVMELAGNVKKHMNKNGIFISSGILVEKKAKVSGAIIRAGFDIVEIKEAGEWCAIAAKPKQGFFRRVFANE